MNRFFKYALMFAFVGLAIFALSQLSNGAEGAEVTWDGGGVDNLASTKENWVGDVAPTSSDIIIFNNDSVVTWDISVGLNGMVVRNHTILSLTNSYLEIWPGFINITGNLTIVDNKYIIDYGIDNAWITGSLYMPSSTNGWIWMIDGNINSPKKFTGSTTKININGVGAFKLEVISDLNCTRFDMWNSAPTTTINMNECILNCEYVVIYENIIWNLEDSQITTKSLVETTGITNPGNSHITLFGNIVTNFDSFNQLSLNGNWTGNIYYNGTQDISTDQQYWTGWLYTQNDIAVEYNAYAYLAFQHDAWLGIQLESWSGTDNFTWNATSVASQTVQWSWSRGESSAMYDEYQDAIYIGSSETNAGGMGTFTSTFVGNHAFLLSRSSFLPASTDISDDVWLGIIFMSIATLITLFGYVRNIGLVMIISFLLLVIGTLASTQIWVELWTLPTLFILVNAVLMMHGLLRKV